jgi:hypothetical protein
MKITDLILHLEKIRVEHGDLDVYNDRYATRIKECGVSSFAVAFVQEPKNLREVRKFWSEYTSKLDAKGVKVLRIY